MQIASSLSQLSTYIITCFTWVTLKATSDLLYTKTSALKLPKPQHPLASYAKQAQESLKLDFSFKVVDKNEMLTTINSLNEKKAAGLDRLSCKTIKKLVKVLSFNMVTLFEAHIYEPSANH